MVLFIKSGDPKFGENQQIKLNVDAVKINTNELGAESDLGIIKFTPNRKLTKIINIQFLIK